MTNNSLSQLHQRPLQNYTPPGAALKETLEWYHSTIVFAGGTQFSNQRFFSQQGIPLQYENLQTPTPNTNPMKVIAMRVEYDFKAAVGSNTGLEKNYQRYVEENTFITWRAERSYSTRIPICDLNYTGYVENGGTLTQHYKQLENYFVFPEDQQIIIPAGANVGFELIAPEQGPTSFATVGTAYLPGWTKVALTNDLGHFFRLRMVTVQIAPIA